MRALLIAASTLSLLATPALAQSMQGQAVVTGPPGLRSAEPMVHHPTHLSDQADRGQISPALPQPDVGRNAGVSEELMVAHRAIEHHRLGLAQSALERAETGALNDYEVNLGGEQSQTARNIHTALEALGRHDSRMALNIIDQTMRTGEGYGNRTGGYGHEPYRAEGYGPGPQR